jgi:predicted metalloprotease with PDZ domain
VMHQPDLSGEVYTEQMWIYEGFTSLYDDLSLARSGVISPLDYVQVLNENITRLLKNPGRHKQSVAESSFEAWSKFYKQDAGSINHIVSYYNKGAVVALCLDIMLRQLSNNAVCLDHVMQKLWADYGQTAIGTPDEVITRLCAQHFNIDIASFIHMATQTSMDLPLPTLLQSIGLHLNLRPSMSAQDKGGPSTQPTPIIDVGASLMDYEKSVRVVNVQSARAASIAGLQVNDIIVSVNYWQCSEQRFYTILGQFEIGQTVPLHVLRDGRLLELSFTLFPAINDTSDITICDESLFKQWLGVA